MRAEPKGFCSHDARLRVAEPLVPGLLHAVVVKHKLDSTHLQCKGQAGPVNHNIAEICDGHLNVVAHEGMMKQR